MDTSCPVGLMVVTSVRVPVFRPEIMADPGRLMDRELPPRSDAVAMAITPDLVESISKGNAGLVIGTGLSASAGLPSWEDLLRSLADLAGYGAYDLRGDELLEAAQYLENRDGREEVRRKVKDRLWPRDPYTKPGSKPTESHDLLAELPINTVFTTSIDDLLEQAYRSKGKNVETIVGASNLVYWDEAVVNVVKLHGTLDRPRSYIITEADYDRVYHSDNPLMRKLDSLSTHKSLVFLGFDILSPDFKELSTRISAQLAEHRPPRFFLTLKKDANDTRRKKRIDELRRRGFSAVVLTEGQDWDSALIPWLEDLIRALPG